jgi:hypothetical protein
VFSRLQIPNANELAVVIVDAAVVVVVQTHDEWALLREQGRLLPDANIVLRLN